MWCIMVTMLLICFHLPTVWESMGCACIPDDQSENRDYDKSNNLPSAEFVWKRLLQNPSKAPLRTKVISEDMCVKATKHTKHSRDMCVSLGIRNVAVNRGKLFHMNTLRWVFTIAITGYCDVTFSVKMWAKFCLRENVKAKKMCGYPCPFGDDLRF